MINFQHIKNNGKKKIHYDIKNRVVINMFSICVISYILLQLISKVKI